LAKIRTAHIHKKHGNIDANRRAAKRSLSQRAFDKGIFSSQMRFDSNENQHNRLSENAPWLRPSWAHGGIDEADERRLLPR
jgi:hypothetical protein